MPPPSIDNMLFANLLGVKISEVDKDKVVGRLAVTPDICTVGNILHGGAVMAFADMLGAIGAHQNLPEGAAGSITTESKTNFISSAPVGSTVTGESTPVHVGRRLSVWQTRILREDGKLAAIVTQSQLVLQA